jgi:hypothetical protein
MIEFTAEKIEENYNKFRAQCEKLGERSPAAVQFVDILGERLALAPASARVEYHLATPGGLVDHSLRVLRNAVNISKACSWNVSLESLIVSALFHDIGKCVHVVGGEFVDVYVPQDSSWHREKCGEMYKHNEKVPYMPVAQRSLWLMQKYGIPLSYEEWVTICIHDGFVLNENKPYCMKEPVLAHVVMTADYSATIQEKEWERREG